MIRISAQSAIRNLQQERERLGPSRFNKAISRALNESILVGRTESRKAVKDIYNIPQRYLGGINVLKSTSLSLVAKLYASSVPVPMDAFAPKFQQRGKSFTITRRGEQRSKVVKRVRSSNVGVSIEVIKGSRQVIPYAFMIEGGKPRVFARGQYKSGTAHGFTQRNKRINKVGNDTPVKPLLSVTVHAAVVNRKALDKVQVRINSTLSASMVRNVKHLMGGAGA